MKQRTIRAQVNKLSEVVGLDLNYFIGGGFWLILSIGASTIGGIILSSIFARVWPADVYGQFAFLTSALGFMTLTALPGMGQAVTQAVAEGKDGVYRQATKTVAYWAIIGTTFLILGSVYFYFRQNPNLALATFASALAFPISTTTSLYNSFLTGKKLFKLVAVFTTCSQLVSLFATGFALLVLPSLIWVAFFSSWSSAIANLILTFFASRLIKNAVEDKSAINLGINLSFSQIFTIGADHIDKFLIPLILGFSNNAIYAFAVLIPMQIHTFLKVLTSLGQPKIAELTEHQLREDLGKKAILAVIFVAAVVGIYITFAPTIFKHLYPQYESKATFLSQIFALSLLYFPSNLFGLALVKKRETKTLYRVNVIYALSSFIGLAILLPILGLLGAILAKVISRVVQAGVLFYLFRFSEQYNKSSN